jgi:GTPase SAR1 family protein
MARNIGQGAGPFLALGWSPDGRYLAAGAESGPIYLWDVEADFAPLAPLVGHGGPVIALVWSADGSLLASASADATARIWDLGRRDARGYPHPQAVYDVAFSPASKTTFATSGLDRVIRIWDDTTGRCVREFPSLRRGIDCVLWSSDGRLVSGSADQDVRIWDAETGEEVLKYTRLNGGSIHAVIWLEDERLLAAAGSDGTIRILEVSRRRERHVLLGHDDEVIALSLFHDGRLLASRALNGKVRLWDCRRWASVGEIECSAVHAEYSWRAGVAFHPSRPLLVTPDDRERSLRVQHLDPDRLLRERALSRSEAYLTAKVAVLGNSGVGKSTLVRCLMRQPWPGTSPTHGASCHPLAVPQELLPGKASESRAQVVLWDFAGQPIDQLVHQLFLDDCRVALLLTDCSVKEDPFNGVAYWARVMRQLAPDAALYLVFSRSDLCPPVGDRGLIRAFMNQYYISRIFITSARSEADFDELRDRLFRDIPWERIAVEHVPRSFVRIRRQVLRYRNHSDNPPLVPESKVADELRRDRLPDGVVRSDLEPALKWLDRNGEIVYLEKRAHEAGESLVVLRRELLDGCASAVIRRANGSPEGRGEVDDAILQGDLDWPTSPPLPWHQRQLIIAATVRLLLEKRLCFRDRGHLVFPTAVQEDALPKLAPHPAPVVSIEFRSGIERTYASLVAELRDLARRTAPAIYRNAVQLACGEGRAYVEVVHLAEGAARLDLSFEGDVQPSDMSEFVIIVKTHVERDDPDASLRFRQ